MSRWADIFKTLKNEGFDVYSPGQKIGDCTTPYIVVKQSTTVKHNSFSTNIKYYSVLCYVPKNKYSMLEDYVESVKIAMKKLKPMIKEAGSETSSYYDEAVKAHMVSVDYLNYRKL